MGEEEEVVGGKVSPVPDLVNGGETQLLGGCSWPEELKDLAGLSGA